MTEILLADWSIFISAILLIAATEVGKQKTMLGVSMACVAVVLWVGPIHYLVTHILHASLITFGGVAMACGMIVFGITGRSRDLASLRWSLWDTKSMSLLSILVGYLVIICGEIF